MGRKPVFPPKIYHHKASGREYVRIRHGDGSHTDIYLEGAPSSPESKAHYARLVATLAAHGGQLPPPVAKAATVAEVVARFMEFAESEYDPAGREVENFALSCRPLLRLYGSSPAQAFDSEGLLALQKAMASGSWMTEEEKAECTKRKRPIGWCRNVVNRRIVRIKTLWKWAESRKLVPPGSYHHLQTVRGLAKKSRHVRHTTPRGPTTRANVEAALPHCPKPVAAMLDLQWWTGCRSGEVRTMRTCEIDCSGEVWLYAPGHSKNDWRERQPDRVIALGPEAQKILGPWLRPDRPDDYLFRPSRSRRNDHYTEFTYPQAVRRACAKAGVKFVAYCCRHSAKARITRQQGLDAARAVLGHKSLTTTSGYASQIDLEQASEVAREVG